MIGKRRNLRFFGIFVVVMFFSLSALAQQRPSSSPRLQFQNRGAQYYIGAEDELLIKVNIWGFVKLPGQYLVPSDTDLISLISYAGGPLEQARINKVKLIRTMGTNSGERVIEVNVKKFLETGDMSLNPQLMPNDTIIVHATTYHWVLKGLDFVAKLGSITYFAYFAIRMFEGR